MSMLQTVYSQWEEWASEPMADGTINARTFDKNLTVNHNDRNAHVTIKSMWNIHETTGQGVEDNGQRYTSA